MKGISTAMTIAITAATFLAAASCGSGRSSSPTPGSASFRKAPYLMFTGMSTSMTVLWQTDATPATASIAWGSTSSVSDGSAAVTESSSATDGHQFSYTITGLGADARTYYQVAVDGQSKTGSFRTAPDASATTLTFYGYGDTRTYPDEQNNVMGALLADIAADPDRRQTFLIHGGDFINYGLNEAYWDEEYFDQTYTNTISVLAEVPVIGAMGNHEMYVTPIDQQYEDEHAGELFRKYWPNTLFADPSHFYFSIDYGPLHIAYIDQYTASFDSGSTQYAWLENDLSASTKTWKMVVMHAPMYSASRGDEDNSSTGYLTRIALEGLLEQESIPIVIEGHQHYYSRSEKDGVEYLVLGGGGAPLTDPESNIPYLVDAEKKRHFARFEISGNTMDVTIIDKGGNIIDAFQL